MKKLILTLAALVLVGCVTTSLVPDSPEKRAVAFCNSFAGALQKMTVFKQTGNLDAGEILAVDNAVDVIEPYCTSATIQPPTQGLVDALDRLLIIQLARR